MTRSPHETDYISQRTPKCPHCGVEFAVWNDNTSEIDFEDGALSDLTCKSCDKTFVCSTEVHYLFSTAVDEDAADMLDWGPQPERVAEVSDDE